MRKYFEWIFYVGLLTLQGLTAQEAAPAKPEVVGRKAWVVATTMPKDVLNPLPVHSGEKLHEIRMHLRSVGQAIPVDKSGVVRAVEVVTGPDDEVSYKNLSFSQIPEDVGEALIVLVPREEAGEGLRFKSKVIDLANFKGGGCLYVNLVKTKIGIILGEQKVLVKPGEMKFINPLAEKDKEAKLVSFFYEVPRDKEWKLMTSFKKGIYESRREICIFFYNKDLENVDFRGIPLITPQPSRP